MIQTPGFNIFLGVVVGLIRMLYGLPPAHPQAEMKGSLPNAHVTCASLFPYCDVKELYLHARTH